MKFLSYRLQGADHSRSPQGERGLKLDQAKKREQLQGRSPQGERGLKSTLPRPLTVPSWSLPARGAWIEIIDTNAYPILSGVAPRKGSVD